MPVTYEKIATVTASSSATIDFNSISGSYTDLILISNLQPATSGQTLYFRVNGSSTSYSITMLYGTGTTAVSSRLTNWNYGLVFDRQIGLPTTYTSMAITNFMNYSNTTTAKTILTRGGNGGTLTETAVTLWNNTSAITSISLAMTNGNITSGVFTLYGILKA